MTPLFSEVAVSLNLEDAPEISDGQRVVISDSLRGHLLSFLGQDFTDHIHTGHIGKIAIQEYGSKCGPTWLDRHICARLTLPVDWTTIDITPGMRLVAKHTGKPSIFVTQEFLYHLRYVAAETYDWELVS